ncbi:hypothetical protein RI367_006793 [Sorochytrium milnesiophthora]
MRLHHARLFATAALLRAISTAYVALGQDNLPAVDWTKVATSSASMSFLNTTLCLCDITHNYCDSNCCCDPDCNAFKLAGLLPMNCSLLDPAIYTSGGLTLMYPLTSSSGEWCLPSLIAVNAPSLIPGVIRTIPDSLGGGFCVVNSNNPTQGTYFVDPGTITTDATFNQISATDNSSYSVRLTGATAVFRAEGSTYQIGDPLMTWNPVQQAQGYLMLPASPKTSSAMCSDMRPTAFMQEAEHACARSMIDVAKMCTSMSVLDVRYYLAQLTVLPSPASTLYGISLSFNQPTYFNPATKQRSPTCYVMTNTSTQATLDPTCSAPGSNSTFQNLAIDANLTSLPRPVLNGTVCQQIVQQLELTVGYTVSASAVSLTRVWANVTFASFDYRSTPNMNFGQRFVVKYYPDGSPTGLPMQTSGNPGYIFGMPVLAGMSVSSPSGSATTIARMSSDSLRLLATNPLTMQCTSSSAQDVPFRAKVNFGQNAVSGCTVAYSQSDLVNNCPSVRAAAWDAHTGGLFGNVTHVGRWGNSSYTDPSGWVQVLKSPPANLRSTDPGNVWAYSCANVLQHTVLTFLWADIGPLWAPQPTILGARVTYVPTTLTYRCANPVYCTTQGMASMKQKFVLTSTVRWIRVGGGLDANGNVTPLTAQIVPPPPNLFPPLPSDWFYPF